MMTIRRPPKPGEPTWYAFLSRPQQEPNAKAWLRTQDAYAWYPTEKRFRRTPRAKVKLRPYHACIFPRYVFARFEAAPRWHILRDCRYLTGVISVEGEPVRMSDAEMAHMAQVPEFIARRMEEEAERRKIVPGVRAVILDGAYAGWTIDVQDVRGDVATFIAGIFGARETAVEVGRLERVA